MDHRVEIRLWLHPPLTLRNACATQKTVQFVHLKKINAIRHSRTNLQMVPLHTLIANSLLHFFSISLCKINQHTEPCPYIISFNGRKYETASSELAFSGEKNQSLLNYQIDLYLATRFVFWKISRFQWIGQKRKHVQYGQSPGASEIFYWCK